MIARVVLFVVLGWGTTEALFHRILTTFCEGLMHQMRVGACFVSNVLPCAILRLGRLVCVIFRVRSELARGRSVRLVFPTVLFLSRCCFRLASRAEGRFCSPVPCRPNVSWALRGLLRVSTCRLCTVELLVC